jgi:hypothetical protein
MACHGREQVWMSAAAVYALSDLGGEGVNAAITSGLKPGGRQPRFLLPCQGLRTKNPLFPLFEDGAVEPWLQKSASPSRKTGASMEEPFESATPLRSGFRRMPRKRS